MLHRDEGEAEAAVPAEGGAAVGLGGVAVDAPAFGRCRRAEQRFDMICVHVLVVQVHILAETLHGNDSEQFWAVTLLELPAVGGVYVSGESY